MQIPLCDRLAHLSRRSLLMSTGGSLFLSPLAGLLARSAEVDVNHAGRPKSVILLWLEGGPSQLETFDPHPGTRIGGDVAAIETTIPGLQISEFLPQVAQQMHRTALVRSVTSREGDHQRAVYNVKTGFRPDPVMIHPSIGAIVCHQSQQGAEIPRHISILPGGSPGRGGFLGPAYDAFKIFDPSGRVPDVKRRVSEERFGQRVDDMLSVVEAEFARDRLHGLSHNRTVHRVVTEAALTMMDSEQLSAFDISRETPAFVNRFGDSAFGRGCLAALRLIEVGVRCVEVTLGGWDSHVNNHELQASACRKLDSALATLLESLHDRELADSTLVVCGGEFGRTPNINALAGRDHWPHGFSVLLAGAGIRSGAVYGATSPQPDAKADDLVGKNVEQAVGVEDLHATILAALDIPFHKVLDTPVGRPLAISEGEPIAALLENEKLRY